MVEYQLPPLKNERKFEEFICDLFNEIEKAEGSDHIQYQLFGVKGQQQKGIDIFSPKSKTVIQCKLKNVGKNDVLIERH